MHALRAFSSLHSGSASFCGALFLVCIASGSGASPSSDPSGLPGTGGCSSTGVHLTDYFGGRRLFHADNWWNYPIPPVAATQPNYVQRNCGRWVEQRSPAAHGATATAGCCSSCSRRGATDNRWTTSELKPAFGSLRGDDFEVRQLGWR